MKSAEWEQKRQERIEIDKGCVMCGRPLNRIKKIQVHHVSYRNLGNEDVMNDLCTLCGSCHRKIHSYYNRVRGSEVKSQEQR